MTSRPVGLPTDFAEAVLDLVAAVPEGHVVTYGDVAAMLGTAGARAVGTVLARYGSDVPWWRVIRSGGLPPRGHESEAVVRWRAEGTPLLVSAPGGERVDLSRARWAPGRVTPLR